MGLGNNFDFHWRFLTWKLLPISNIPVILVPTVNLLKNILYLSACGIFLIRLLCKYGLRFLHAVYLPNLVYLFYCLKFNMLTLDHVQWLNLLPRYYNYVYYV